MQVNGKYGYIPPTYSKHIKEESNKESFHKTLVEKAVPRREDSFAPIATPSKPSVLQITINSTDSVEVKLTKLQEIAENTQYPGMTGTEIYKTIWDRYNDAFGGNMSAILSGLASFDEWNKISSQFRKEINSSYPVDRTLHHAAHAAILGYDGMSPNEIEAAIAKKYEGKNSVLDFLNMYGELRNAGVLDSKLGGWEESLEFTLRVRHWFHFAAGLDQGSIKVSQEKRDSVLEADFNGVGFFGSLMNITSDNSDKIFSRSVGSGVRTEMLDTVKSVYKGFMAMFAANSMFNNPNGFGVIPGSDDIDYNAMVQDLLDRYFYDDEGSSLIDWLMKKIGEHYDKQHEIQHTETVEKMETAEPVLSDAGILTDD